MGESKKLPRQARRNKKRASGWEKDPLVEIRVRGGIGYCTHHSHTPPATLDFLPGQRYRHICLHCGCEIVIRSPIRDYSLNIPDLAAQISARLETAIPLAEDRTQQISLCAILEQVRQLQREVAAVLKESASDEPLDDDGDV